MRWLPLRDRVTRFLLQGFFVNHQAPNNKFFENLQIYSQVKVYQWQMSPGAPRPAANVFAAVVNYSGGKFASSIKGPTINLPPIPLVLLTLMANFHWYQ